MLENIKSRSLRLARLAALFVLPIAAPLLISSAAGAQVTPAQVGGNLCTGSNLQFAVGGPNNCPQTTETNINTILKDVVNIFSVVVGVIAVIMIIVGGFRYITSGGDSGNVSGAKNAIVYALIGLVVVALAQVIVHFVLGRATQAANGG